MSSLPGPAVFDILSVITLGQEEKTTAALQTGAEAPVSHSEL